MSSKIKEATKELIEEAGINNDLKTFIFNKDEVIQKKVFTSSMLNNNIFGFGLLLPRTEDILDRKGKIIGNHQVWRPVVITSNQRGLVYSQWFQSEYKINFEEIPYEMKLKWELKDIENYLHGESKKVNGLELFNKIKKEYEYYLYFLSKEWYSVNALWDIGTYLHQLFSAYPLKEERGLGGTAKTKTMVVSSMISLNATDIMINPSESTLFRETEEKRPTRYVDEAEKLFIFTKQGMIADSRVELINASYTKNGSVARQEQIGKKFTTKWYHVYSPTRISSINGLYGTTESRAITQIHTKSPDVDKRGERDPEDDMGDSKWSNIRNECYLFALQNWKEVYDSYINFNIETKLKKRDLQLWKPLLVLSKIIDEKELLPMIISFAEKTADQKKTDYLGEGTLDYKLLFCLNELIKDIKGFDGKAYVDSIRAKLNELYNGQADTGFNKTISTHLDKIGFKEFRGKDRFGSYFEITKEIFDEIVTPLTNDFISKSKENTSQSSQSSQNKEKEVKKCDEYDMNMMNNKNKCDEYDENDECDDGNRLNEIDKIEVIKIKDG